VGVAKVGSEVDVVDGLLCDEMVVVGMVKVDNEVDLLFCDVMVVVGIVKVGNEVDGLFCDVMVVVVGVVRSSENRTVVGEGMQLVLASGSGLSRMRSSSIVM